MTDERWGAGTIELAIVGAGAAGTFVAHRVKAARPDWSVALFERTDRIGGRLRSLRIPGVDHPVELGGMRFLTTHRRVSDVVNRFAIPTHPFGPQGGTERSYLRGRFGAGASDPRAGDGYKLPKDERGRSAIDLLMRSFENIVPNATRLDEAGWAEVRASHEYCSRPVADWPVGEAIGSLLSPEGHQFVVDAFGYDSGLRAFNVADAIPYLLGGGNPNAEARTPNDGMDAIPRAMARAYVDAGGSIYLEHEVTGHEVRDGIQRLRFANGKAVAARRVIFTGAVPALRLFANASDALATASMTGILSSVEAFPAAKLYVWYERPWWYDGTPTIRMTTDLPLRKLYYFGHNPDAPAVLLAMYTDGLDTQPWRELANGTAHGEAAPSRMLDAIDAELRRIHPGSNGLPAPLGSAVCIWGDDQHETGWTFWRAGARSDDVIGAAVQPIPGLDLFVCGEGFSRAQAWVEGALETAELVTDAILA